MTVDTLIMLSGALVAIAPFIGLPGSPSGFLAWALFLLGLIIVGLGVYVRRGGVISKQPHTPTQSARNTHKIVAPPTPVPAKETISTISEVEVVNNV
jgi:hypothetical protein